MHCYRYAWAERAFQSGYPERFAQAALGHSSKVIHQSYAKRARIICPALDEYEGKASPLSIETSKTIKAIANEYEISAVRDG